MAATISLTNPLRLCYNLLVFPVSVYRVALTR